MVKNIKDIVEQVNTKLGEENLLKTRYVSSNIDIENETIKIIDIFNVKYTPIFNHRFVCCLPGIDAYLVNNVDVPKLNILNGKLYSKENIKIRFYESVAPSTKQQLYEFCKNIETYDEKDKILIINQLDACGTIISKTKFTNIIVRHLSMFNDLSYTNNSLSNISLEISFDECIVEY